MRKKEGGVEEQRQKEINLQSSSSDITLLSFPIPRSSANIIPGLMDRAEQTSGKAIARRNAVGILQALTWLTKPTITTTNNK